MGGFGMNNRGVSGNSNNINNNKMMGIGSAIGAGAGLLQSGLGMIGQRQREKRANKQNEKMQGIQFENQKKLNTQGQELAMDMWNKTNYGAQRKHLEDAGLNVGLMYGGGGAGGTTANSGSGGSASGGGTIQPQQMMDIGALDGMMKMAQIDLTKAQEKKTEAEAENLGEGGIIRGEAQSRIAVNEGQVSLNLSKEEMNDSAIELNKSTMEVQESVKKLNASMKSLNNQKVAESIKNLELTQADLDWMEKTGLNKADSVVKKTVKYLSEETGLTEGDIIMIVGGLKGAEAITKIVTDLVGGSVGKAANTAVKGFRR